MIGNLFNGCLWLVGGLLFVGLLAFIAVSWIVSGELNSRGLPTVTITDAADAPTENLWGNEFKTPKYLTINGKKVTVKKAEPVEKSPTSTP